MAKVQITTYYDSSYCEICLWLAVVKINPSVSRMLTSIYTYNAFKKFGPWSKKHQRSEGPGNSAAGPQQQARLNDGAAGGAQCQSAISGRVGDCRLFHGDLWIKLPSVHLGQYCNFIPAVFRVWNYPPFCCSKKPVTLNILHLCLVWSF